MISSSHHFIYLHAPKTGGNSIQTLLLPFSDDKKVLKGHQNGVDRFEVEGALTGRKHSTLSDYATPLGDKLSDYRVLISVRHPLDRAISFYFSPHRWMQKRRWFSKGQMFSDKSQNGSYEVKNAFWDIEAFETCLQEITPMVDFMTVGDETRQADHVIRFESINEDFDRCTSELELASEVGELPHVNKSVAPKLVEQAKADPNAKKLVERYFSADYRFFGY